MEFLSDVSLVDGPFFWFAVACGVAGAAFLLWRRRRTWPLVVAASVIVAAGTVLLIHWILIDLLAVFSEDLPFETLVWSTGAVAAVVLCIVRLFRSGWKGRVGSAAAMLGVVLLCVVQVNSYFGLNNTVADLLGTAVARVQPLEPGLEVQPGSGPGVPLSAWKAPGDMPRTGTVRRAKIPGNVSGFEVREAYIYLPPAYLTDNRPSLPVLVLFPGQPGAPADWLTGGQLRAQLDKFAGEHGGIAPVTVVVDPNGSPNANTLCMDSRIARADTYLAHDVPAWISSTLAVSTDHGQWAVGGFSFGGTCAVQMGTVHPDVFPSVVGFSAEEEPALAKDRNKTIADSFGGDVAAFEARTPLVVMKEHRYQGNGMYLTAGASDTEFIGYMKVLGEAARGAGFDVEDHIIAHSGHSWDTVVRGMPGALDFLSARWGLGK